MSSTLFKNFIRKAILTKQGAPGPPPRQGLQWKPQTHRWIRPKEGVTGEESVPGISDDQPVIGMFSGAARGQEDALFGDVEDEGEVDFDDMWASVSDAVQESVLDGDFDKELQESGIDLEDSDKISELIARGVTDYMGAPSWGTSGENIGTASRQDEEDEGEGSSVSGDFWDDEKVANSVKNAMNKVWYTIPPSARMENEPVGIETRSKIMDALTAEGIDEQSTLHHDILDVVFGDSNRDLSFDDTLSLILDHVRG